jgi:hypothetical protein
MKSERGDLEKNLNSSHFRLSGSNCSVDRSTLYLLVLLLCGGIALDYWLNGKPLPFQSSNNTSSSALSNLLSQCSSSTDQKVISY